MNLRARDYRRMAAQACKPYSGTLALITLLYIIITCALSYTGIGLLILGGPFTIGYIVLVKKVVAKETPIVNDIFSGFNDQLGDSIVTYILHEIFILLWTLLLIIPGIIKSYSYAMTFYVVKDEKLSGTAAITRSRELMHGNKWKLFCLNLSYIGWIILSYFTLGILLLWIIPKMETARYMFYLHITGKDAEKPAVEEIAVDAPAVEEEAKDAE